MLVGVFCRPARCSGRSASNAMVGDGVDFTSLSSGKHDVKIGAGSHCGVEEVALALGEVIGHGSIKICCLDEPSSHFVFRETGAGEPHGGDRCCRQWRV